MNNQTITGVERSIRMWNISYTYFSDALLVGFYAYTSLALEDIDYRRESFSRTNNVLLSFIILATVTYLKILYCHLPGRTRKCINNPSLARNLNQLPPKYIYVVMTISILMT
jgi:hypothetical protein